MNSVKGNDHGAFQLTLSIWLDEKPEQAQSGIYDEVDIAIIGGGIIGAGCAYLLRAKGLKVALFESSSPAGGATGRCAGFVLRGIQAYYKQAVERYGRDRATEIFQFAVKNQELIRSFKEETQEDFELESCGSYLLAASLEELETLEESSRLMNEDGFEVEFLRNDPIDRGFYGALFNRLDFAVNPAKLVRALLKASSASVFEREEVSRIEKSHNGSAIILRTPKRKIACDKLLIAANAYAPLIEPWFSDAITTVRGQIIVTKPLKKRIIDSICYANYGYEYFRQLADNRLLLGGCRQFFREEEEKTFADCLTRSVQTALENYLKNRFSDFAGIPVDYRFSGLMAFTRDGLPLVGELERLSGAYFAVGMNGHGLGYGLNMSRLLVDCALEGKEPGIFDARRLTEHRDAVSRL